MAGVGIVRGLRGGGAGGAGEQRRETDRDGVELCQLLRRCKLLMDQNRVDAFHIGQYDKLL